MSSEFRSPFHTTGLAEYPVRTPLVGQAHLFQRMRTFVRNIGARPNNPEIFLIEGRWGSGKTRLGLELIAQLLGTTPFGWSYDAEHLGQQLLEDVTERERRLPLYMRYVQVAERGAQGLTQSNILPLAFLAALKSVLETADKPAELRTSNVDRINADILGRFRLANLNLADLRRLVEGFTPEDAAQRAPRVVDFLRQALGLDRLFLVIDEVETAGETVEGELPPDETLPDIGRRHISMLASSCKEMANEMFLPAMDYVILASPRSAVDFKGPGALAEGRIRFNEIGPSTFADLETLRASYQEHYELRFPGRTEEIAFFAAGRNFRWYNIIMSRLEEVYWEQYGGRPERVEDVDLFWSARHLLSGTYDVFDLDELEAAATADPTYAEDLRRVLLHLLPVPARHYGDPSRVQALLQAGGDALGRLRMARLTPGQLARAMDRPPYVVEGKLIRHPDVTVDATELLRNFQLYSGQDVVLYFEDSETFAQQLQQVYPLDNIELVASDIQEVFDRHQVAGAEAYIAPTTTFIQRFCRRWRVPERVSFLVDDELQSILNEKVAEFAVQGPGEQNRSVAMGALHLLLQRELRPPRRFRLRTGVADDRPDESGWGLNPRNVKAVLVLTPQNEPDFLRDLGNLRRTYGLVPLVVLYHDAGHWAAVQDRLLETGEYPPSLMLGERVAPEATTWEMLRNYRYSFDVVSETGFQTHHLSGLWERRASDFRRNIAEQLETAMRRWRERGWVLTPILHHTRQGRLEDLALALRLTLQGTPYSDLQNSELKCAGDRSAAVTNVLLAYEGQRAQGRGMALWDESGNPILNPVHRYLLQRLLALLADTAARSPIELALDSPAAREFLYDSQGSRLSFSQAFEQHLSVLAELGLVDRVPEDDAQPQYFLLTPSRAIRNTEDSQRTLENYEAKIGDLSAFYEAGVITVFKLDPPSIHELQQAVGEVQDRLRGFEADWTNWETDVFLAYAQVARQAQDLIQQVSVPAAPEFTPLTTEVVESEVERMRGRDISGRANVQRRVNFLEALQQALEERCGQLASRLAQIEDRLDQLEREDPTFAYGPIRRLIAATNADTDLEARRSGAHGTVQLPADLVPEDGVPGDLWEMISTGRLDVAWKRMERYLRLWQTDPSASDSLWARFLNLRQQWAAVRREHQGLDRSWERLDAYLQGASESDRAFLTENEGEKEALDAITADLGSEPDLDDLQRLSEAVQRTQNRIAALRQVLEDGEAQLKAKLEDAVDKQKWSIVVTLCNWVGEPYPEYRPILESRAPFVEKLRRIEEFNQLVLDEKGRSICRQRGGEDQDWENYKLLFLEQLEPTPEGELSWKVELQDLSEEKQRKAERLGHLGLIWFERRPLVRFSREQP